MVGVSAAVPIVGEVLAERFRLERLAGSGGMGLVFEALDLHTASRVAVKVLLPTRLKDASFALERFLREAELLAELRHPQIVHYLSHGVASSEIPFLAMEWLEGEDLSQRLPREPLSMLQSLKLCRKLAEGLAVAHQRGIVHRDIKPSDIAPVEKS